MLVSSQNVYFHRFLSYIQCRQPPHCADPPRTLVALNRVALLVIGVGVGHRLVAAVESDDTDPVRGHFARACRRESDDTDRPFDEATDRRRPPPRRRRPTTDTRLLAAVTAVGLLSRSDAVGVCPRGSVAAGAGGSSPPGLRPQ